MRKEEGQDAQDNEAVGSSGSNPLAPFWMYTTGGAEGAGGTAADDVDGDCLRCTDEHPTGSAGICQPSGILFGWGTGGFIECQRPAGCCADSGRHPVCFCGKRAVEQNHRATGNLCAALLFSGCRLPVQWVEFRAHPQAAQSSVGRGVSDGNSDVGGVRLRGFGSGCNG